MLVALACGDAHHRLDLADRTIRYPKVVQEFSASVPALAFGDIRRN
jgi:hypothetical protein